MNAMRATAAQALEPVGSLAQRWQDLHTSAAHLAKTANLAPEAYSDELAAFPAMLGEASEWQREMAWQAVEDIDAMMRPGLAALDTLADRGKDATAPAVALWREFYHARQTVLALVHPGNR